MVLDGSASADPDSSPGTNDDIIVFEWFENFGLETESFLGTGEILEVNLPVGSHVITLRVTDTEGATDTDFWRDVRRALAGQFLSPADQDHEKAFCEVVAACAQTVGRRGH